MNMKVDCSRCWTFVTLHEDKKPVGKLRRFSGECPRCMVGIEGQVETD